MVLAHIAPDGASIQRMDRIAPTGRAWVAVQTVLFGAIVGAPLIARGTFPFPVPVLGVVVMAAAVSWMAWSYRALGSSHSAWVAPTDDGGLVTTGPYAWVRHPIYAGWIGLSFGWGLATGSWLVVVLAAALAIFYDARARAEERLLEARFDGYRAYRAHVNRLIPGVY